MVANRRGWEAGILHSDRRGSSLLVSDTGAWGLNTNRQVNDPWGQKKTGKISSTETNQNNAEHTVSEDLQPGLGSAWRLPPPQLEALAGCSTTVTGKREIRQ